MGSRTRFRRTRWLALLAVAATVLTACGGGSDGDGEVATLLGESAANADAEVVDDQDIDSAQGLLDFAACMRENGVEMADPSFDADGNVQDLGPGAGGSDQGFDRRSDEFQTAIDACGELLEGTDFGRPGGRGGFDRDAIQEAFNTFTACLRDEGVQVDDIAVGGAARGPGVAEDPPAEGGFAGGRPEGAPADGARGGEGFDPADRIIQQLDLDEQDPTVTAAVEACQPLLQDAFTPPADDAA